MQGKFGDYFFEIGLLPLNISLIIGQYPAKLYLVKTAHRFRF